ncbi:1011_t:CDS:1 [Paraglomus occultum]|uniref:1011_t:CDS:1 n=1 Tax=Paraglomus occultum TaxID=144539 RepID=A0A9N8VFV0_9GLOM|nr:1011_t:CDS:1 [Paraglomus occultum]
MLSSTRSSLLRHINTEIYSSLSIPSLLCRFCLPPSPAYLLSFIQTQRRYRAEFAPRNVTRRKAHKGRIPIRIGGSTKGTTIVFGDYGLRVKDGVRLSSQQLTAAHWAIRRKIKSVKGSRLWMRVFPDIPVTSKGNESRMGKGKGAFEYWACRVPKDKIVFEIGGGGIRKEVAKEALRLAGDKLPVTTEFVERAIKENTSLQS